MPTSDRRLPVRPGASSPRTAQRISGVGATASGVQSSRKSQSDSRPGRAARSPDEALSTRLSTDTTGLPAPSTAVIDTASVPVRVSRTRNAVAPVACRDTPSQTNGSTPWPGSSESR